MAIAIVFIIELWLLYSIDKIISTWYYVCVLRNRIVGGVGDARDTRAKRLEDTRGGAAE